MRLGSIQLSSPNFHLQSTWADLLSEYSPTTVNLAGTYLLQLFSFVFPCLILDFLLPALAPKFALRHKTQPPQKQPSPAQVRHCVLVAAQNNLLVLIPYTIATIYTQPGQELYSVSPMLPSFFTLAWELLLCILVREALFYYIHRGLHHPSIYQYIHKTHHSFPCPVSWTSQYAHPVEHIVSNVLPVMLPPALLGSHQVTLWTFAWIAAVEGVVDHSGYTFFGKAAKAHDRHHERSLGDYGTVGILDWWHGTTYEDKVRVKVHRAREE